MEKFSWQKYLEKTQINDIITLCIFDKNNENISNT